jgi:hypothetical protein
MNQESEHLRLLAIFHYVVAGLAALFSLFPLIYTTIGAILFSLLGTAPRNQAKNCRRNLFPGFLSVSVRSCFCSRNYGDLYPDRGPMPFPSQGLFLRAGDCLH